MYTTEEVKNTIRVFDEYSEAREKLIRFLEPVAQALNYQSVSAAEVTDSIVGFTADWYGSYQSEDHEVFTFPVGFLESGQDAIIKYLKLERARKETQLELERKKQIDASERAAYERLKKKFEP